MAEVQTDGRILRELALIYIALAHSTDQKLDPVEVDVISRRLNAWRAEATEETVLSAVKKALEEYIQDGALEEMNEAIRYVGESLPAEQRRLVLEDLVDIAMADDKFLHEEGTFINRLAEAWDMHPGEEDGAGLWSILGERRGNWGPIHDLALIYLTLAHRTDEDLSTDEIEAITDKLGEWLPQAHETDVLQVVQEAIHVYAQSGDQRMFARSVEAVRRDVPAHQRAALLADLRYVARADGILLDEEQRMIDRLARAWE